MILLMIKNYFMVLIYILIYLNDNMVFPINLKNNRHYITDHRKFINHIYILIVLDINITFQFLNF